MSQAHCASHDLRRNLPTTHWDMDCFSTNFTDEKINSQKGSVICPITQEYVASALVPVSRVLKYPGPPARSGSHHPFRKASTAPSLLITHELETPSLLHPPQKVQCTAYVSVTSTPSLASSQENYDLSVYVSPVSGPVSGT